MNVQRWAIHGGLAAQARMFELDSGPWVRWDDVRPIVEAELEAVRAESRLAHVQGCEESPHVALIDTAARAQQELDEARARVAELEHMRERVLLVCDVLDEMSRSPDRAVIAACSTAVRTALGQTGEPDDG